MSMDFLSSNELASYFGVLYYDTRGRVVGGKL